MLRAYKYRIYPTKTQTRQINITFGCSRWVYNWALSQKIEAWSSERRSVSVYDLTRRLPTLKTLEGTAWLSMADSQALQSSLRNLDAAFINFASGSSFPKFKKKSERQSFQLPQRVKIDWVARRLILPKIGRVRIALSRSFSEKLKTVTISRDRSGKHFASILVDTECGIPQRQPFTESTTVGVDVGLESFATLSTGEKIPNPRFLRSSLKRIGRSHRRLSCGDPAGRNTAKRRLRLARLYERVRNQRNDFLHKLSTRLISENQAVALETISIIGILRSRRLGLSVGDAGLGEFMRQLRYKAEWSGKTILAIGRFEPSSKLCTCGVLKTDLSLKDREWTCSACGVSHDRDILAARNIKMIGLCASSVRRDTPELTPVESR